MPMAGSHGTGAPTSTSAVSFGAAAYRSRQVHLINDGIKRSLGLEKGSPG